MTQHKVQNESLELNSLAGSAGGWLEWILCLSSVRPFLSALDLFLVLPDACSPSAMGRRNIERVHMFYSFTECSFSRTDDSTEYMKASDSVFGEKSIPI